MARNLGMVTAYAYAVAGGYTGTEAEFEELLGNIADDLSQIENLSVTVTTLTPGSSATASYSNGVLALGIPRGNTGATGNGISAIIKTGTSGLVDTYTVTYTNGQTMTYTVTNGAKGDTGNGIASIALTSTSGAVKTYTVTFTDGSTFTFDVTDGEVTNASLAEALEDFSANGTVANAEQLTTDIRANDQTPYLFRTAGGSVDIGDREYINGIVGGTVAWNQLVPTAKIHTTTTVSEDVASTKWGENIANLGNSFVGHAILVVLNTSNTKCSVSWGNNNNRISDGVGGNTELPSLKNVGIYKPTAQMVGNNGNTGFRLIEGLSAGTYTVDIQLFDLTQMFGSTIADYIYSLEQATAGAGVAFFKSLFPKPYYAYNAGELKSVKGLVSHDMTGFNQMNPESYIIGTGSHYNVDAGDTLSSGGGSSRATTSGINPITVSVNTGWAGVTYISEPLVKGSTYKLACSFTASTAGNIRATAYILDGNNTVVERLGNYSNASTISAMTYTPTEAGLHFAIFIGSTSTQNVTVTNLCCHLVWDGSRNGEYEPYQKWSYPLDSDLELRGIPKIENGNLYYDGDEYLSDGTVNRRYDVVTLDGSSDEDWLYYSISSSDNANNLFRFYLNDRQSGVIATGEAVKVVCNNYVMATNTTTGRTNLTISGANKNVDFVNASFNTVEAWRTHLASNPITLVFPLATPTTETADPYTSPQIVSDFGTEEYVIDDDVFAIPVGHNTDYPVDLKAKLEMAPNSPPGDGMYVVKQTSGTNEYVPLIIPSGIPPVPTENGSYTLTATVSGGTTTLSWS